ncbi:MAG: hypothetical protein ACRET6_06055 [Burkholderiales bacterium]
MTIPPGLASLLTLVAVKIGLDLWLHVTAHRAVRAKLKKGSE